MVKKLKTDEFSLDDDLNIPDFNFDGGDIPDDRKPVTKLKDAVIESAKSTLTNPSTYAKVIKGALPKEYGEAHELADSTLTSLKGTADAAVKEVKPAIGQFVEAAEKLVPEDNKRIRAVTEKIKEWVQADYRSSGISAAKQREDNLQLQLGEIFKNQEENAAASKADGRLKTGIDIVRHKDQMTALNSIASDTSRLQQYQNKVTQAWQRKTLEIQLRSYGAQIDILEELKRSNEQKRVNLEAIRKNTGLPDFVKTQLGESFHENMRNKFVTKSSKYFGGMFTQGEFMKKTLANLDNQIKSFASDFGSALSMMAMPIDMMTMMDGMEMGGRKKTLGERGASWATEGLINSRIAKETEKLKKYIETSPNMKHIRDGQYIAGKWVNPEYLQSKILELANSQEEDTDEIEGFGKKGLAKARNLLRTVGQAILPNMKSDMEIQSDKLNNMRGAAAYSNHAQKAITEIIPGYLSRILREVTVLRTGDNETALLGYDLSRNMFRSERSKAKDIRAAIVKDDEREHLRIKAMRGISELDTNNELTTDQQEILAQFMARRNLMGEGTVDVKNLTDKSIYQGTAAEADAQKFIEIFNKKFATDENGKFTSEEARNNHAAFTEYFHSLGKNLSDPRAFVQDNINVGEYEALRQSGYMRADGKGLNLEKIVEELIGGIRKGSDGKPMPPKEPPAPEPPVVPPTPEGPSSLKARAKKVRYSNLTKAKIKEILDDGGRYNSKENVYYNKEGHIVGRSDVNVKENITPTSPKGAVESIKKIGTSIWNYKLGTKFWDGGKPQVGPMAQDVNKVLGEKFAPKGKEIDLVNLNGLNMTAIQGLDQKIEETKTGISGFFNKLKEKLKPGEEPENQPVETVAGVTTPKAKVSKKNTKGKKDPKTPLDYIKSNTDEMLNVMNDQLLFATYDISNFKNAATNPKTTPVSKLVRKLTKGKRVWREVDTSAGGRVASIGKDVGALGVMAADGIYEGANAAYNYASEQGQNAWDKTKEGYAWSKQKLQLGKKAFNVAKEDFFGKWDLYLEGEIKPRLEKAVLAAGGYYDQTTGKVIVTLADVKGNIVDRFGNLVLTPEQLMASYYKLDLTGKMVKAYKFLKDKALSLQTRAEEYITRRVMAVQKFTNKVWENIKDLADYPRDLYLKGEDKPRIFGHVMRNKGYFSQKTKEYIRRPSDIDGTVIDAEGNVVVSLEEMQEKGGLHDAMGRAIQTPFFRVVGMAWRAGTTVKDKLQKIGKQFKDYLVETKDKAVFKAGEFFDKVNMGFGFGGKAAVDLLTQIRDILDDRMPGKKKAILGDNDGDGDRDNSYADKQQKIKESGDDGNPNNNKLEERANKNEPKRNTSNIFDKIFGGIGNLISGIGSLFGMGGKASLLTKMGGLLGKGKGLLSKLPGLGKLAGAAGAAGTIAEVAGGAGALVGGGATTGTTVAAGTGAAMAGAAKAATTADKVGNVVDGVSTAADVAQAAKGAPVPTTVPGGAPVPATGPTPATKGGRLYKVGKYLGQKAAGIGKVVGAGTTAVPTVPVPPVAPTVPPVVGGPSLMSKATKPWGGAKFVGKGVLGAGKLAGKAVLGTGKLALGIGKLGLRALPGLGTAYGLYSGVNDVMAGNYGSAAMNFGLASVSALGVGGTLSMLGGAAGMLGAGAAAIGGALFSPIGLGILGAAAVGYGAYKVYKFMTRKEFKDIERLRFIQYGLQNGDDDHFRTIRELEQMLSPIVNFNENGAPTLKEDKLDFKKVFDIFDINGNDSEKVERLSNWVQNRFKPVFLTHMAALYSTTGKKNLDDMAKMTKAEKLKMLPLVQMPNGPWNVTTSPFPGFSKLPAGPSLVEEAYIWVKNEIDKIKESKEEKVKGVMAEGSKGVGAASAANFAAKAIDPDEDLSKPAGALGRSMNSKSAATGGKDPVKVAATAAASAALTNKNTAMVTIASSEIQAIRVEGLTALKAVRFKAYGLPESTYNKVLSLNYLEEATLKDMRAMPDKKVLWVGDVTTVTEKAAQFFEYHMSDSNRVTRFTQWFLGRFLPVYTTYLADIYTKAKKTDKFIAESTLTTAQSLETATLLSSLRSAWRVSDSPWAETELLTDSASCEENIEFLRAKVKDQKVAEEKASKNETGGMSTGAVQSTAAKASETRKQETWEERDKRLKDEDPTYKKRVEEAEALAKESAAYNSDYTSKAPSVAPVAPKPQAASTKGLSNGDGFEQFITYGPYQGGKANIQGLNPQMKALLCGLIQEYGELTGKKTTINRGFVTYDQQAKEFQTNSKLAARPGTSMHEFGLAVDINRETLNEMDKLGLLKKYGFTRPVGGEPWHLEPAGLQLQRQQAKKNPELASQLIAAGPGNGGGGFGTVESAASGKTNPELAKKLLEGGSTTTVAKNDSMQQKTDSQAQKPESAGEPTAGDAKNPQTQVAGAKTDGVTNIGSLGNGKGYKDVAAPTDGAKGYKAMEKTIEDASKVTGVDKTKLASIIGVESSFNPNAGAKESSAQGLGQFTKGTWDEMVKKYGKAYGIEPGTSPKDPRANAIMTGLYYKENETAMSKYKGNVTEADVYAGHMLGPSGSKRFHGMNDSDYPALKMKDAAASNKPIFYKNGDMSQPRTKAEIMQLYADKLAKVKKDHGIEGSGEEPVQVAGGPNPNIVKTNFVPDKPLTGTGTTPAQTQVAPKIATPQPTVAPIPKAPEPQRAALNFNNPVSRGEAVPQVDASRAKLLISVSSMEGVLTQSLTVQQEIRDHLKTLLDIKTNEANAKSSSSDTPAQAPATPGGPSVKSYAPNRENKEVSKTVVPLRHKTIV